MHWTRWTDFLAMGGYAFYVWGAFGACALAVVVELATLRARRRALASLAPADPAAFDRREAPGADIGFAEPSSSRGMA